MASRPASEKPILQQLDLELRDPLVPEALRSGDVRSLIESQRRLQMLCTLGWRVCESSQLQDVLDAALYAAQKLTGAQRCFVVMHQPDGTLAAQAGYPSALPNDPREWSISKTIIRRALSSGRALLSSDAMREFSDAASVQRNDIRSVMCVPFGFHPQRLGVLYADNRVDDGVFSELDLRFFTALGHFVFLAMRNAIEHQRITEQRDLSDQRWMALQEELLQHHIVGSSQVMLKAYERLRQVAGTERPVLLLGPTGVGKDLFAKAAHSLSPRHQRPFIRVDIAALSEDLIESELFGHEKGAFTNAIRDKRGRFELADGGTLFLDEVGNIPLRVQAKLLRVLESGEFERVGAEGSVKTNVRLISATNVDLEEAIRHRRFREDLYYRLAGVTVSIPPLRERPEDIPELVRYILADLKSEKTFDVEAIRCLQMYSWPGNVRQLIRVVGEIDVTCPSPVITPQDIPAHILSNAHAPAETGFVKLPDYVRHLECEHVRRALALTEGNNNQAIELLGISREKFFKIKKRLT